MSIRLLKRFLRIWARVIPANRLTVGRFLRRKRPKGRHGCATSCMRAVPHMSLRNVLRRLHMALWSAFPVQWVRRSRRGILHRI